MRKRLKTWIWIKKIETKQRNINQIPNQRKWKVKNNDEYHQQCFFNKIENWKKLTWTHKKTQQNNYPEYKAKFLHKQGSRFVGPPSVMD